MNHFTERGIVALAAIASCTTLLLTGHDTQVGWALVASVVGYFGLSIALPMINNHRKGGK